MKKSLIFFLSLCLSFTLLQSQNQTAPLQNFSNPALFDLNDTNCINLSGEWLGEETEWINQSDQVKGKYQIKFLLNQQGNKVTGQSFISFDNGNSYGKFNIRGMVLANKLYFEEYAIQEQNFTQANVAWCLRTGELEINKSEINTKLEGGNYKGYATNYFFECHAKVAMNLQSKNFEKPKNAETANDNANSSHGQMRLFPNPADKEVNISFNLNQAQHVSFDIYTLKGEFINNIIHDNFSEGSHQFKFSTAHFVEGVYLVRMHTEKMNQAAMLIISR